MELWTPKCLSHLAGGVGRPLYADAVTEQHQKLGYARVCVEVGFDGELPDSLVVELLVERSWKLELSIHGRLKMFAFQSVLSLILLNLPRLGFPWKRVRFTGPPSSPKKFVAGSGGISVSPNRFGPLQVGNANEEKGLQEQISVLRKDDLSS